MKSTQLGAGSVYFKAEDFGKMLKLKDENNLAITDIKRSDYGDIVVEIVTPIDNIGIVNNSNSRVRPILKTNDVESYFTIECFRKEVLIGSYCVINSKLVFQGLTMSDESGVLDFLKACQKTDIKTTLILKDIFTKNRIEGLINGIKLKNELVTIKEGCTKNEISMMAKEIINNGNLDVKIMNLITGDTPKEQRDDFIDQLRLLSNIKIIKGKNERLIIDSFNKDLDMSKILDLIYMVTCINVE